MVYLYHLKIYVLKDRDHVIYHLSVRTYPEPSFHFYAVTSFSISFFFFLGFDTDGLPSAVWPGGETEALTRLERHLERKV